jgi:polyisoprenyl-teichoic acid--peptidoglycan teichoic acid transferase
MGISRMVMRALGFAKRYWTFLSATSSPLPSLLALILVLLLLSLMIIKWPESHTQSQGVYGELGERYGLGQVGQVEEDADEDEQVDADEDGQVNVLLIGYDSRDAVNLSDTLMVAQFEEDSKNVRLLSIPRDFYVFIPNAREPYQKINTAHAIGGPELATKTVESFTSIPIDHYAAVDFKGFTEAIDAVGGVTVEVEKHYYEKGYSNINLAPGKQTLNGEQALAYVRFRHDPRGDLGRIERQQKILSAMMDKLVSVQGVRGIPELVRVADEYVDNDLSRAQMLTLGWRFQDVHRGGTVESVTLEGTPTSLEDQGFVLIPDTQKNSELLSSFRE